MASRINQMRSGFTLIELLVVIAIIAILIALLVPAVQKVRDAAANAQCVNNLKQIALACHNHHDAMKRFPPGGANDEPPFGTDVPSPGHWGSSWMVYILPYIDQAPLYEKWQFFGQSGAFNANNNAAASGVEIAIYLCPASPLPHGPAPRQGASVAALGNYSGISGAINGLIPGFNEIRVSNVLGGGIISGGGVMIPNGQITTNLISDGTSNTMMFSEHSNYVMDNKGVRQDWRPTQPWGWYLGVKNSGIPPNFPSGGDNRSPGLTTIRYQIEYAPAGGWVNDITNLGVGVGSFTADCTGANTPLNSTHPGGVNVAFCDGTVRPLSSSTSLMVLAVLATRDDGQAVE